MEKKFNRFLSRMKQTVKQKCKRKKQHCRNDKTTEEFCVAVAILKINSY